MLSLAGFLGDTYRTLGTLSDASHTRAQNSWATWNTSGGVIVAGVLAQFPCFFDSENAVPTEMKDSTGT